LNFFLPTRRGEEDKEFPKHAVKTPEQPHATSSPIRQESKHPNSGPPNN